MQLRSAIDASSDRTYKMALKRIIKIHLHRPLFNPHSSPDIPCEALALCPKPYFLIRDRVAGRAIRRTTRAEAALAAYHRSPIFGRAGSILKRNG
jgi:hypothetical protein